MGWGWGNSSRVKSVSSKFNLPEKNSADSYLCLGRVNFSPVVCEKRCVGTSPFTSGKFCVNGYSCEIISSMLH